MSHEHLKSDKCPSLREKRKLVQESGRWLLRSMKSELSVDEAIQALDVRVKLLKNVREREPDDLSAVWSYTTAVDKYSRLVREAVAREEELNNEAK